MTRTVAVVLAALLGASCGSRALGRSEAAEKLKDYEFMKDGINITIVVGEHCDDVASYSSDVKTLLAINRNTSGLQRWVTKGFVSIDAKSFQAIDAAIVAGFNAGGGDLDSVFGSGSIPRICRRLTDSPRLLYWKATVTPQGAEAGIPPSGGVIQTHLKRFGDVTGIATNQDGTATVEFTYFWEPTEAGKKLGESGAGPEPARATFKKYDDGWRIMSAQQMPG